MIPLRNVSGLVVATISVALLALPAMAQTTEEDSSTVMADSEPSDETASVLADRQGPESVPAKWSLHATNEGVPALFRADVTASADISELVIDIFVDGSLVDSARNPDTIVVDLAKHSSGEGVTLVTLVGRESASTECVVLDGVVSFSNVRVSRKPTPTTNLNSATLATVTGEDPVAVANMAAAVEREMILPGASVTLDAPVTVEVLPEEEREVISAAVSGLDDQDSFSVSAVTESVQPDLRTIQRHEVDLDRSGGNIFVSSTDFGGRVSDVELSGEINSTPLAEGGGYAIEVNGTVVSSGALDSDGRASFETPVAEWPRDADVVVRLALREDREACSPGVVGFAGTADFEIRPFPADFGDPTVRDFPQRLLEDESVALWVEPNLASEWVGVAIAALQDTSGQPLYFHEAKSKADAVVRLTAGSAEVSVVGGGLNIPMNEQIVENFSVDRYWDIGLDAEDQIEVDVAAESVSVAPAGFETPRAGWFVTAAVAAAAVAIVLLFRKNSRHAP